MKKTVLSFLVLLPLVVFSQQTPLAKKPIDSRLYEAYGKAYVDDVANGDSFLIDRWTFYLDNAYYITDELIRKDSLPTDYPSVTVPDLKHINILKLEQEQLMKRDYFHETIYKIKGTSKYLIYYSGKYFIESLNEYFNIKQQEKK